MLAGPSAPHSVKVLLGHPDAAKIYRTAEDIETFSEDEDAYSLETIDFIDAIREDRPAATRHSPIDARQFLASFHPAPPTSHFPNLKFNGFTIPRFAALQDSP